MAVTAKVKAGAEWLTTLLKLSAAGAGVYFVYRQWQKMQAEEQAKQAMAAQVDQAARSSAMTPLVAATAETIIGQAQDQILRMPGVQDLIGAGTRALSN